MIKLNSQIHTQTDVFHDIFTDGWGEGLFLSCCNSKEKCIKAAYTEIYIKLFQVSMLYTNGDCGLQVGTKKLLFSKQPGKMCKMHIILHLDH